MTPDTFPQTLYTAILILTVSEFIAAAAGKNVFSRPLLGLRTLACACGVAFVWVNSGHPPLFGPFEALAQILFVSGSLGLMFSRRFDGPALSFFIWHSLSAAGIVFLVRNQPMTLNQDYFMYANPWVILFFTLRLAAAGTFVHCAVQYLSAVKGNTIFRQGGRNTLLAGACIYLSSEWAGSLWALNWMGDAWHWSRGFFKAAILFLLIMGASHLPARLQIRPVARCAAGVLPAVFILWMIFYH
ncbi:MAG: hypothetical protein MI802_07325 [Desulfobacterales bacterium]|nr:hypothetical protein [Desulfobacterales bacterium]